ncbi:DsbA family oxidoreductase [Williamsia sp. MIQD14]|uniref:DsbA family oxidoreductase n=1 Tax=Williamsia sp. MIQD14 TaxID=3425703 RepID=UPI003DA02176
MNEQDTTRPDRPVSVEMWSDLGCPWCHIGKHRLERAIAARPDAERFVIRLRSFELNPDASRTPETIETAFRRSHGGDAETVLRAEKHIQALALREGLSFSVDRRNANTGDVHRVTHHAEEAGRGREFFSLVQDRFFAGDIDPFDPEVLVQIAVEVGLSRERVREVLAGDEYAEAVRADRREGRELGAQGVPFVVVDGRLAASGAQSVDAYARMLDQAVPTVSAGVA